MSTWKRYDVHVHGYGRRLCQKDGPCQGLLNWPEHKWGRISTRPLGLKSAIALADAQSQHAVVTFYMSSEEVHDNGKPPAIPYGWWPPDAQTAQDRRGPHNPGALLGQDESRMVCVGETG